MFIEFLRYNKTIFVNIFLKKISQIHRNIGIFNISNHTKCVEIM